MASKEEIKLLDTYREACTAYDATLKAAERATVALQKAHDRNTAAWAEHAAAEEVQLAAMEALLDGIER